MEDKVIQTYRESDVLDGELYKDACVIIDEARQFAYRAVNVALTLRNWKLGERITREHLDDDGRAEYGKHVIEQLAAALTKKYGKGFDRRDLYTYIKFYQLFPQIVDAVSRQSGKVDAVSPLFEKVDAASRQLAVARGVGVEKKGYYQGIGRHRDHNVMECIGKKQAC
ncbi:MAG: DUF1016 N-terminal domain-containing protein [Bacteroidales bacterium]|nr:DUF1016 N-terminal domain-containing protein [Bacteroidales bacterium]